LRLAFHAIKMVQIYFVGCNQKSLRFSPDPIFPVSVAPAGLEHILSTFPWVPFGHPRLAYKPAQHLTVAPGGDDRNGKEEGGSNTSGSLPPSYQT
jgi:hypothetical protein